MNRVCVTGSTLGLLLVPPLTVLKREPLPEPPGRDLQAFVDLFLTRQTATTWQRSRDEMLCGFEVGDADFQTRVRAEGACAFAEDVDAMGAQDLGPSLILTGRPDRLVGYWDAWRLLERFPRATYAVLDAAGHGLQIEQPALFRALVGEWLLGIMDLRL